MSFVFIATIGPVQPFIASARRTRDLYAGSTLLSELSKAAAEQIAQPKTGSATLIFPAPSDIKQLQPGSSLNVANKIVAVIELSSQDVQQLGEDVHNAINERLTNIQKRAFGSIELADTDVATKQLEHLVDYSWVAVAFGEQKPYKTYEIARKKAEETLASRKNTHVFTPVTWGSHQEKSSIDGKLECVIPAYLYQGHGEHAKTLYKRYNVGPYERLSAVDLLKRLSAKYLLNPKPEEETLSHITLSTSHIAATPFLRRLNEQYPTMSTDDQQTIKRLWNNYIEIVKKLVPPDENHEVTSPILETLPRAEELKLLHKDLLKHEVIGRYDGAMLFKERLLEDVANLEKSSGTLVARKTFNNAQSALKEFFAAVGMYPSPYYALLCADGDGMGKAIEVCTHGNDGQEQHRKLSQKLAEFSKQVAFTVQKHYGALVYAGGDDVMALLPLDDALACAHTLSEEFSAALSDFSYEENGQKKGATLSVGIAVVHHVSLLDEALALARSAEHRAKELPRKNALAITIRKRSGEDYPLTVSWKPDAQSLLTYEDLKALMKLCKNDVIPKGTAYELRDMLQRLQPAKGDPQFEKLQKIIQIEAARILRRKLLLPDRGSTSKKEDRATFTQLLNLIGMEAVEEKNTEAGKNKATALTFKEWADIPQFINALIVAQAFAEEERERKEEDLLDG